MWPFTPKTLYDRYSKLIKLIMSIDSHFEVTENKRDSVRLHLPNYKGNQPMDFHIYLMEPFLFISFVTEIEEEKISCVKKFPKDTDQQDMFNVAMAANLEKIHQILDEKYDKNTENNKADTKREKKKEGAKELTEEQRYALYYYVHSFTTPMYYNGNDNTPSLILRMYKKTLGLSDYDVEYIINTPLYRISEHLEHLKSIDDTTTINMFLYSCVTIIDKAESGAAIKSFLGIIQDLGISEEKLKDIIRTIEPTSCEHFFDRNSSDIWDNLDEEDTEELSSKTAQCETDGDASSDEVNSLNYFFDFDESYKKHIDLSEKTEENTSSHNSFEEPAIVNSWSLLDFARAHGKMKRIPSSSHINSETGEEELSAAYCIFVHPTNKDEQGNPVITAIVSFSQELGELTAKEIGEQKDNLIVVEYESGNYSLKRKEVVEEETSSAENTDKDLFITQLNNCSFEKISTCANNLLLSLVNCKLDEVNRKLLVAELTILSSAMVLDTKDEKISHWYNFVEKRILDYYLSIKEVTNYDDWIESNTPGMCSNDLYTTEEAIPLAEFERDNGQIKFYRGQINAYPYDDSFWGEFINKNGQKQIIYVNQGFPFEYNTTDILNRKSGFGIVEEKDTYYHSEDVFYCLKEIKSRDSMLSSYVKERFTFYKKTIGEILANHNNDKAQIFQLYNAVTNERLNFNVPYLGINDLVFNDETVVNDETGEMYQYDATSLSNFSKCIEGCLAILHQGIKNSIPNSDLVMVDNQSIEYDCFRNDVTGNELNNALTDEYGAQYSADKRKLLYVPDYIEEYSIAEGTEEIGDFAFVNIEHEDVDYNYIMENNLDIHDFERYTSKLVSVCIPNSVEKIGKGIFDYCTKLAIISIPEGSTEKFKQLLPDYEDIFVEGDISTIAHYKELEDVWIDKDGVKYSTDKRKLLKAPGGLTKYAINPHTKVICDGAFFDCANLKEIHLPESIAIIGKYAFYGCDSLSEINLPKAVLKIGEKAFDGCKQLNSLFIPRMEQRRLCKILPSHFDIFKEPILNSVIDEKGVVYDNDYQILHFNTLPLDTYSIKSGVKTIDDFAFKPEEWKKDDGTSLQGLSLPNSVVLIGAGAFAFNQCLSTINIPPKAALSYDFNPFAGCLELHTIKWESDRAIKEGTLVYNEEKTALIACLPWQYIGGVTKSWTLFDFARQYGKMQVGEFTNKETGDVFKSCIFTNTNDGTRTFVAFSPAMGELTPQEIARQKNELIVVQLESGKYSLCKGKMSIQQESHVEVPYGIEIIAAHAFYKNDVLEIITFPPTLKAIGTDAFDGCSSLRVIYIPKGTLAKFEKIIPELRELMIERSDMLPF